MAQRVDGPRVGSEVPRPLHRTPIRHPHAPRRPHRTSVQYPRPRGLLHRAPTQRPRTPTPPGPQHGDHRSRRPPFADPGAAAPGGHRPADTGPTAGRLQGKWLTLWATVAPPRRSTVPSPSPDRRPSAVSPRPSPTGGPRARWSARCCSRRTPCAGACGPRSRSTRRAAPPTDAISRRCSARSRRCPPCGRCASTRANTPRWKRPRRRR